MLIKTQAAPEGRTHLFRLDAPPGAATPLLRTYENGFVETIEYQSAAEVQTIIDSVNEMREINNWRTHRPHEEGEPVGMIAARVPITLYTKWRLLWRDHFRDEMPWMAFLTKMLNHRDFRAFNAMPGKGVIPHYSHQDQ